MGPYIQRQNHATGSASTEGPSSGRRGHRAFGSTLESLLYINPKPSPRKTRRVRGLRFKRVRHTGVPPRVPIQLLPLDNVVSAGSTSFRISAYPN